MTVGRSEPRPALRKAADGAMHPAMPRWETPDSAPDASVPDPTPSAFQIANPPGKKRTEQDSDAKKAKKKGKGQDKGKGKARKKGPGPGAGETDGSGRAVSGELVTVSTTVPKGLRKQAKRKAEAEGRTLEQALAHLIQVWAGGGHT